MVNQLFRDWKFHKNQFLTLLVAFPLSFLFGGGLLVLIMVLDGETDTYICLGTMLCVFSLFLFTVINGITYHQEFTLALSMGQTRRRFMASYALRKLVWLAAAYVMILLLYQLELAAYRLIFPHSENEMDLVFLWDWRVILPSIVTLLIANMFIGSVYSRFGKTGGLVLYFVWMAGCLGLPRLLHEGSPVVAFILSVPVSAWIATGIAVLAAMLAFTICQGRKQMVR